MYGENSDALRTEIAALLRIRQIMFRLGAPRGTSGIPATTTEDERRAFGRLIQNYRYGILTWCSQAVRAGDLVPHLDTTQRGTTPDAELRKRIDHVLRSSTARLPDLDELTSPHQLPLVESWRQAARSAALGEHDFTAFNADLRQRITLVKDTGDIVLSLCILDRRYANVPGWEPMRGPVTLEAAAETCSLLDIGDRSIDTQGWRPPTSVLTGPAAPGIHGVIQAERNLLIHLEHFPSALNFRRIVETQRTLSLLAADRLTTDSNEHREAWDNRGNLYEQINHRARNLGGLIGTGAAATTEARTAVARLQALRGDIRQRPQDLRMLNRAFAAVDLRMADIFQRGVRERLYFARVPVPGHTPNGAEPPARANQKFTPIHEMSPGSLAEMIRERLRPPESPESRDTRGRLRTSVTRNPTLPSSEGRAPAREL